MLRVRVNEIQAGCTIVLVAVFGVHASVSNPHGGSIRPLTLLSFSPPEITSQPESLIRYRGETAAFTVSATGLAPLSFQWFKEAGRLAEQTAATLTFTNLHSTNAGNYYAIVTDDLGNHATSAVATLTIIEPQLGTNRVGVIDASLHSAGGNPQGFLSILVGRRGVDIVDRGLLRPNLSAIPKGAILQSVVLRLTLVRDSASPADAYFDLHRMLRLWTTNATWFDPADGAAWAAPGGQAGTDYVASPSATTELIRGRDPFAYQDYDFGPTPQLTQDVADWLVNPDTNYGWLLKVWNEAVRRTARHFGSSDSTRPPQLLLRYTHPDAPQLTGLVLQGTELSFQFNAADGWFYRVESCDIPGSDNWTKITNFPAGPPRTINVSVPRDSLRRFYRVIAD